MDEVLIGSLLASTLRLTTPLLLCALAGLLSERAGVVDIGLEGKMLAAAFAAAATAVITQSALLGMAAAMAVAVALSVLHGVACVSFRGDQVVSGMALNMVAAGLTAMLGVAWFAQGGQTPPIDDAVRLQGAAPWRTPEAGHAVQAVIGHGLLSHNALVYVALLLVPLVAVGLARTRAGLRLRAVGENPAMVAAAGLSVSGLRYAALVLNGLLCGLAGSYLTLAQNAAFSPNMTAGRGYMALAALIFGHWKPWPTLAACLLFGALDALAIRLQGVSLPGLGEMPVQAIQALPYLLTVVLLAGFVGRARAPAALGIPFGRSR